MKKANWIINIIMGAMAGFFVGYSGYEYIFYLNHSNDYMPYSAPWYTGIILCGILVAVIEAILIIVKIVMRFLLKNMNDCMTETEVIESCEPDTGAPENDNSENDEFDPY